MTTLHGATEFEKSIVEHILKKEARELLEHLSFLRVEKRENTGVGVYVYFKYLGDPPISHEEDKTLGQCVYAEIEGLKGGAGFLLYVDQGRITMLECFSHSSETWPSYISKFDIRDL